MGADRSLATVTLLPDANRDTNRAAVEVELLTQLPFDEPAVTGLEESGGEQHEGRRARRGLRRGGLRGRDRAAPVGERPAWAPRPRPEWTTLAGAPAPRLPTTTRTETSISAVTEWISTGRVEPVPGPGSSTWWAIPAELIFTPEVGVEPQVP